MKLSIKKYLVKDVIFSGKSEYANNIIYLNKDDLIKTILHGIEGYRINIEVAKPQQNTRIVHIMDTVKPSYKKNGSAFSGWLSKENKSGGDGIARVGYVYYIQAQGDLRNVHIYGRDNVKMDARYMHPNEILDGAIVSGNYIIACQKNPTYFHQDNPVIKEMYERDGQEFNFAGVIVSTESSKLDEKQNNAKNIAEIAKKLELDGVIVTQEGGGHADVDLMLALEECEKLGIKVVIQTNEIAGPNGDLPPLVSYSNMADAVVSNGNNDQIITVNKMENSIGGEEEAFVRPRIVQGPVGPGLLLNEQLKEDFEVVVTVICGDNYILKILKMQLY